MKPARWLDAVDRQVVEWMRRHGILLTRIALGLVFAWFGILKFFPALSPAEDLATRTIARLSGGSVGPEPARYLLAGWEVAIGAGLLSGRLLRVTLFLLFVQMAGTLTPLLLFPRETFSAFPYAPTLEGQYIIKNLVLISAAVVVGATVRGSTVLPAASPRSHGKP